MFRSAIEYCTQFICRKTDNKVFFIDVIENKSFKSTHGGAQAGPKEKSEDHFHHSRVQKATTHSRHSPDPTCLLQPAASTLLLVCVACVAPPDLHTQLAVITLSLSEISQSLVHTHLKGSFMSFSIEFMGNGYEQKASRLLPSVRRNRV
uniref:Uncharacterized protein n=1 Tax=Nothobranchius furzeri TaxID=105023 RepID=A0A1A7ZBL3_NOTFU